MSGLPKLPHRHLLAMLCQSKAINIHLSELSHETSIDRVNANGFRNPIIWLILWGGWCQWKCGRPKKSGIPGCGIPPLWEGPSPPPHLLQDPLSYQMQFPWSYSIFILSNFHCYAIILTLQFRGALCKINHDDGNTYILLTRWPVPCQTQFKLPLPIYQQSKPPLSGPC